MWHITHTKFHEDSGFASEITRGWHNRPGAGAVPIASKTKYKKKSNTEKTIFTLNLNKKLLSTSFTSFM
jgi:hypothetical protein